MSFVRVRMPNGYEVSLNESFATTHGLEVLDEPATNLRGRPLPATRKNGRPVKPRVSIEEAAASKAKASSDTTTTGGDAEGGTSA